VADKFKNISIHGILVDLGFCLDQIKTSGRGFSFQQDEPLDMRFNPEQQELTAQEIINRFSDQKLIEIFKDYGEERFSRRIAEQIVENRKEKEIKTSQELADLIWQVYPAKFRRRIHPATKVFQALRIQVNDEINKLIQFLPQAVEILQPQGRLAIISFHSLEDRQVKHFFKNHSDLQILTKKPIQVTEEELKNNPASRSAKLRVAQKQK
jgi:16S rRNA (cytosine1402-N4)-methyltransferase